MTEGRTEIEPCIAEAIGTVRRFLAETLGDEPEPEEIARALTRYFVLKEIKDHVLLGWESDA